MMLKQEELLDCTDNNHSNTKQQTTGQNNKNEKREKNEYAPEGHFCIASFGTVKSEARTATATHHTGAEWCCCFSRRCA